ncbi:hypothetical protein B0H14DRAFT_3532067 [Mycena olivaceomarginata]|nr:hypothetical protein B0H14DRAFT_3532067 [Mycena olivaceomarginata]
MAPKEWATQPQLEYLRTMLPKYRDARTGVKEKSLARFWLLLDNGWFSRYPVEAELGIIVSSPGAEPLTPDELKLIGDATMKMKKRLRTWMHTEEKEEDSPLRALEVYQKIHRTKIRSKVMRRGYRLLNEEAEAERVALARDPNTEMTVMTLEESQAKEQKVEDQAVERILIRRGARGREAEVLAQMEEMNGERALGLRDDISGTCVPEEYQHAIDQLPEVVSKVTRAIEEETGWMGLFMAGGPMLNQVKGKFGKFLKRAFPHDVHDTRGIVSEPEAATVPGGLISSRATSTTRATTKEKKLCLQVHRPKSSPSAMCRKKLAAAVSAAVPPGWLRARPVPTLVLSAPATDAIVTTEQEDVAWALGPADGWDSIVPPVEDPEAASPWNGLSLPSTQGEEDVVRAHPVPHPMHLGAPFVVDHDVGDSGSVPASAACSATLRVTSATGASATVMTPTSPALAASATLTTLTATPLEPTPTPTTPAEGPPHSAAALTVWNACQRERVRTGDPAPTTNAASSTLREDPLSLLLRHLSSLSHSHGQTYPAATLWPVAAESARLRGEEQRLRRDRMEQLRLSKDLEKKAAEAEAVRARRRNPAGGADLVVVTRPQRSQVPARNPNGSPIVHEGQAETDAALLASLKTWKRKADVPAAAKRKKARR